MAIIFGVGGIGHGFFEALQGFTPTDGLVIHAIGEADKMWEYGNEPAFTVIPNFLITGIASMAVGIAIIVWSVGFLHRRNGPTVLLLLFVLLFLVGGGIGQVVFFSIIWVFSTFIHKRLKPSKSEKTDGLRKSARFWLISLVASSVAILFALEIAVFGLVPFVKNPDTITLVMLSSLAGGFILMILAFLSGMIRDAETNGRLAS
jgi:ABC-type polysaccharide/polyol phosphate export permease